MTQRARRRQRRSSGSVGKKILLGIGVLVALIGIGVASVGLWVLDVRASAPSIDELKPIDRGAVSEIFASDGSVLGYIQSDAIRDPVTMEEIPKPLQEATVAIEDEDFYNHGGVDYEAVARAAVENIEAGFEVKQGGSTITQQLVRNLYIPDPEQTLERKIIEAKLAEELEDEHSKRWILGEYLNTASYGTNDGRTAVGVEAASQVYFNKHVSDLNLDEAALIAGLPQAPSEYNPFQSAENAKERRNEVLQKMYEQGYISQTDYDQALNEGLGLDKGYKYQTIHEPYFFDYVEQELIDRYGVNTVRQGGLKVYTTINPRLQTLATTAAQNGAATLGGPSAALVSIDPSNGHIVAMASSSNYSSAQYNLAAQGHRQPGSAFKPFVLTTALKQGIDPYTTYYNGSSPVSIELDPYSAPWVVNNAEGGSAGVLSIAAATTASVNAVYAQLDVDVGPENVAKTAHSLGITSPLDGFPAEGIGGLRIGVSPLEMSDAYATFASNGVHHDATAISRVEFPPKEGETDGEVDVPEEPEGKRVLSDGIAYEVTKILKTVVASGTGTAANIGCPQAGKTGTTDDQTDAWFVGYTPQLSTAVWTGYPDARTSMGGAAFGGAYAAPIWHEYMTAAHGSFCEDFPPPENPASYSSFYSGHTVSPQDFYDTEPLNDKKKSDNSTDDTTGGDTNGYDPDLYAPGAGQDASPSPDPGGGNQGGGGNPGGGNPGGGNGGVGG
jgi:penicillin-binding protein 1A